MTRRRDWLLLAGAAAAAAAAGFGVNVWRVRPDPVAAKADPAPLLASRLPDLDGKPQPLEQWRGKVLVVNFWATWCTPCREEIPLFVRLQNEYAARGVQFIGIAIDQPDKVKPFAAELAMNYPNLIGDVDSIELGRRLGNRAGVLPFTVIFKRDGSIATTEVGAVKQAKLEPLLLSLI